LALASNLVLQNIDADNCVVPIGGGYSAIGGTVQATDSNVTLRNLLSIGSRAPIGGAYYFDGNTNATMTNVTTHDAQCTANGCWGGALVPEGHTNLLIQDSAFIDCVAPQGFGGAIDDGTVAYWVVRNTLFLRNSATYGGAIYNFGNTQSFFYNCSFINNTADNNGGAVKPSSNTWGLFDGCLFDGNVAASNAGIGPASDCSAYATYCTTVKNSIFRNNYASSIGGGMALAAPTWLENVRFENNTSLDIAGGLYLYLPVQTYLYNLTFIGNIAPNGAAVFAEGLTNFTFDGPTTFIDNTAKYVQLSGDATGIGGGLAMQGQTSVWFLGPTLFSGGSAANGGGISATGTSSLTMLSTAVFQYNHAVYGGALYASSSSSISIAPSLSTFFHNDAVTSGGAIYQDASCTLSAPGSQISDNSARYGGGFATGVAAQNCPNLAGSNFTGNMASISGGAIYIAVTTFTCNVCPSCTIASNTAPFGSGLTSGAFAVVSTDVIPSSVAPSESFSADFLLEDVYGAQVASQDRVVTVSIVNFTLPVGTPSGSATVTLRGPEVAYFIANVASFGILKLSGPPGSKAFIRFAASPVTDRSVIVQMTISPCSTGYVQYESDGTFYCLKANRVSMGTQIGVTIAAGVSIVIGIVTLVWLFIHRNKPAIRKASVLFCNLTTIGAILMFVSAIMFVFVTDATCGLRVWLLVLGFVLCYGSIFVKEYRLWLIFDETDIMRTVRVTDGLLLKVVFGGLFIELLITMTWFIVTPYLKRITIDLLKEEISYRCTSNVTPAFFWILFALNMCILIIGCILAWLARNVPANFNEAKQILFSIYNVTLISVIVVVLASVFRATSEAISLTVSIGLIFSSLVTLAILFVPKIRLVANRDSVKKALLKDITGLERDIAWKKRMIHDLNSESGSSRQTPTSGSHSART